ncbi:MAG: hypothetical protein QNJ97_26905 [Myxococcota bacterium]|nr:hypothetical protein [Myxococcota bacterium]
MTILSVNTQKNNTKKVDALDRLVESLSCAVEQSLPEKHNFEALESELLSLCNEASRLVMAARLEELSAEYETYELLIDGDRYKRHNKGTVAYHSLCGSMKIQRFTYRDTAVRNGPTVVPMELTAGLVERATPALAFRAALGDAQCPGCQWEEQLKASHRRPPSRSTQWSSVGSSIFGGSFRSTKRLAGCGGATGFPSSFGSTESKA